MLEQNLNQIAKYNPELALKIKNHNINKTFEFEYSMSQDVNLIYNDIPLHSIDDPQKEALDLFNSINDITSSTIFFIYGLGLGYLLKRFYMSSQCKIVIFEPELDLLRITLENVDFSKELSDPRVMIVNHNNDLEKVFSKYFTYEASVKLSFLNSYKHLYSADIKSLADELGFLMSYFNNNYYNLYESSTEWLHMGLTNLNKVLNCDYLDSLKNKFNDIPAIIVSAGPSLNKNIHLLKDFQDKMVIISIGRSLRILNNDNNIIPDFCTIIDSSEKMLEQVSGINNLEKVNFILQPVTNKGIFDLNTKRKFVYFAQNDFISNWLAAQFKITNNNFINQGTVAISAIKSAILMGCNPIILIGQDLAIGNDNQVYADKDLPNTYKDLDTLEVDAWHGGKVKTYSSFAIFIRYFENLAKDIGSTVKLINATEGGAYLKGFEHIPLSDALKLINNQSINVEEIIGNSLLNYNNPIHKGKFAVIKAIKDNYDSLKKLNNILNTTIPKLNKITKELNRPDINKTYILKLFSDFLGDNDKITRILKDNCSLMLPYVQMEYHNYLKALSNFAAQNDLNELLDNINQIQNFYNSLTKNIPVLKEKLEQCLKDKQNESCHTKS